MARCSRKLQAGRQESKPICEEPNGGDIVEREIPTSAASSLRLIDACRDSACHQDTVLRPPDKMAKSLLFNRLEI